ncbi:MAG: hypothetical protein EDM05_60185 [Leptolyngbya sp. IPPAS B-1204]|jgi:hypothetical protein|nr:hypothetical protein [Elainella sp. C42_A2020_010]RNJ69755.1 MAG: hypothetical protein EDM05_07755 [Leptolyngbya sp. IPPAS B-1204]
MNKDAEAINQFLAWLLQEPDPATAPSGKNSSPTAGSEESGTVDLQPHTDPLDSEVEAIGADQPESSAVFTEDISSLELGEIPAVQDRFYAIIKRRLRAEIERNPPLFPWESRLWDYESEQPDLMGAEAMSTSFWATQLQALRLPIALPEPILEQIFAECRKLATASLREGVKLVRAVENLFPEDLPTLNYWAGQVLAEPVRSPSQTLPANTLPQSYELANPTQQMVLSLLAARQVLDAMTIQVSADYPHAQRQWLTAAGELVLNVEYQPEAARIRIQAWLPAPGRLTMKGQSQEVTETCSQSETLSLELNYASAGETYGLEVELEAAHQSPFVFAVHLTPELA